MPGTIRLMTMEDVEAVTRLHIDSWRVVYRGILPDEMLDRLDFDERSAARRKQLADPQNPATNWVIEDEGRVRGWAALGTPRQADVVSNALELYAIYLVPSDRGRGYGRTLIQHVIAHAQAHRAPEIVLRVLEDNGRTRRFYEAAGFSEDPRLAPEPFLASAAMQVRLRKRL